MLEKIATSIEARRRRNICGTIGTPFLSSNQIFEVCKERGIKLSRALAAAGLIAAHSSTQMPFLAWLRYIVASQA
uniref:Uncharacterized protein n=1 Tax=Nelumbo nucifera TaxID=4432 RepID=A0A822XNW7_NELNU|nr:TPA_asm: hypothetical protein HUJ06_023450 [Nelumbo nucifera]